MSMIAMSVYSTEENKKDEYLEQTLDSLWKTVDFDHHRLILSVNGATEQTHDIIDNFGRIIHKVIWNETNLGTAKAINKAWKYRQGEEHCIKMDDDVVIWQSGWVELMEEAIRRDPNIGQVGLKRKDCWEHPDHENEDFRSKLINLPHIAGDKWIVVEQVKHVIGTCVMHNSKLLDEIGGLYQPGLYGYDDTLMSWRSHFAGYKNVFIPYIEIDHIDTGATKFQDWKHTHSGQHTADMITLVHEYAGGKSLYYEM